MEDTIIKATGRSGTTKIIKNSGSIPGVLNGPGTTSTSVVFESKLLDKIIADHGKNAKLWVELDNKREFGFIKEVQRHPVEKKIIHVSIQLLSTDQEVKMELPIIYYGSSELEHKMLQLQVYKSEVKVSGIGANMPDSIIVNVSQKKFGDNITAIDLNLPKEINILDSVNEIYAGIKGVRVEQADEAEEAKPVE